MNNSLKIVILSTPFHCRQLKLIENEMDFINSQVFFIRSNYVDLQLIDQFNTPNREVFSFDSNKIQIPHQKYYNRILNLIFNPTQEYRRYKDIANECINFVLPIISRIDKATTCELIIFNDRDLLTQLTINEVKKHQPLSIVTAVDEGAGYYAMEGFKESLLKIIYKLFSMLFLGFDYRFIEQYGTHPAISKVYIQYPGSLPKKCINVTYIEIPKIKGTVFLPQWKKPCILIFSTTMSEDNLLSADDEIKFYENLKKIMQDFGYMVIVKPHPREIDTKVERYKNMFSEIGKFETLEKTFESESIDFERIDLIVHFGSSIAMHILESGFDPKNMVTIKILNFGVTAHLFNNTNVVSLKRFSSTIVKRLN